jgi:hypothetical protein
MKDSHLRQRGIVARYLESSDKRAKVDKWRGPPPYHYWGPGYLESLSIPISFITANLLPYNSWGYLIWLATDKTVLRKWRAIVDEFNLREITYGDYADIFREELWRAAIKKFTNESLDKNDAAVMMAAVGKDEEGLDPSVLKQLPHIKNSASKFKKFMTTAKSVIEIINFVKPLVAL